MFVFNDGGRIAAGYNSLGTDCAIRSIAIALDMDYKEAMKLMKEFAAKGRQGNKRVANGVYKQDLTAALKSKGWVWHSAPKFHGRKARYTDIPGIAILRMAKHFSVVRNGELHDTWDSSNCMVYGYWSKAERSGE